jgi:hypothetical protein
MSSPRAGNRFQFYAELSHDLLEQRVELCSLYRFLQHGRVGKRGNDAVGSVSGDECKRDFPAGENISHRIGFLTAQIHVQYSRLQIITFGSEYGIAEPAVGTIDFVSEGRQHVCQHHRKPKARLRQEGRARRQLPSPTQ